MSEPPFIPPEGWETVHQGKSRKECADRALVLHAVDIPYQVITRTADAIIIVPRELAEKSKFELWEYEQENRKPRRQAPAVVPANQNAIPGVVVYVFVVCLVAWLAGEAYLNRDWFVAGAVDGKLIRDGEWWRVVTALTLHSGVRHLAGNIGFGILFGLMAGRLVGSGVAWFGIIIASAAANLLNTLLLASTHRSIGASTAVFAALGLVSGFVWRAKLMAQDRWPYRLGPVVGGVALLAYTGTGDANTDIGAHLAGFVCGFVAGMLLTLAGSYLPRRNLQLAGGFTALAIVIASWVAALQL
ncbi:MAG: rhomboid family intramembrane serine protease [Woeseiaceae bacterium]|nr:rhomboid family intramembrane serine protease [Woeseiaceae bacterium]